MSLFDLRVDSLVPPVGMGKSLRTNAIAEDGMDYAVKSAADKTHLPLTEWLASRLAQAVHLSTPHVVVLVMPDGSRALGSRLESGLLSLEDTIRNGADQVSILRPCIRQLSACYALDLFLGNTDRHFGNFLFRKNSLGDLSLMPIDYDHAWLCNGWPPTDITSLPCKTTTHLKMLPPMGLWSSAEAIMALSRIDQLSADRINTWMDDCPEEWVTPEVRDNIVTWWGQSDFHDRVTKCVNACPN